ncbi:MAG: outer membrane lipoprotein-sorting protein [Bacteroidota bacterium]
MKTILILSLMLIAGLTNYSKAQNPREISERASSAIELESFEMTATLQIFDNRGNVRERQIAVATKKFGDVYKTIIEFLAPADVRGTAMLIYDYDQKDDDMWIYMPSMRRTRRIVSSEKGRSFMGSEFSNADMSKPNIDDFTYELLESESIDGNSCWKIESKPKTDDIANENGFSKQILYVEKDTYLTQKVEYYDLYEDLNKIMTISDYRKLNNGSFFAYKMQMENVQNGRKSVYSVNQFQTGSEIEESGFSTSALEQ